MVIKTSKLELNLKMEVFGVLKSHFKKVNAWF